MADIEDFDTKLAETKEADLVREAEKAEEKKLQNRKAVHLVNLNEDPQLSQHIYYGMTQFPVMVGRRSD